VIAAVDFQMERHARSQPAVPGGYEVADVADRVVALILGTAKLANSWRNVR
jgi:hypothetical protein